MSRAVATSAFVGTHPVQRQSPPSFSRSISATLRPSRAQPDAVTSPAVPPPMMTTSKFSGMRRLYGCESFPSRNVVQSFKHRRVGMDRHVRREKAFRVAAHVRVLRLDMRDLGW